MPMNCRSLALLHRAVKFAPLCGCFVHVSIGGGLRSMFVMDDTLHGVEARLCSEAFACVAHDLLPLHIVGPRQPLVPLLDRCRPPMGS